MKIFLTTVCFLFILVAVPACSAAEPNFIPTSTPVSALADHSAMPTPAHQGAVLPSPTPELVAPSLLITPTATVLSPVTLQPTASAAILPAPTPSPVASAAIESLPIAELSAEPIDSRHLLITATNPATPKPKATPVTANPASLVCARPENLTDTKVNTVWGPPFCIVWVDEFEDEQGYRISLDYFQSGELFIYEVGVDVDQLIVPDADAPRLNESLEQCLRHKDYEIFVTALRPNSEERVDGMAFTTHCPPSLPTATKSTP